MISYRDGVEGLMCDGCFRFAADGLLRWKRTSSVDGRKFDVCSSACAAKAVERRARRVSAREGNGAA